jgi:hypothetical protein
MPQPAAMANLLGDLWIPGTPDWASALSDPSVKLHLYGKAEARPGRKMGHLNATAATAKEAVRRVRDARAFGHAMEESALAYFAFEDEARGLVETGEQFVDGAAEIADQIAAVIAERQSGGRPAIL